MNEQPIKRSKEPHPMLRLIDPRNVPNHIAIIMDGNGRWATSRGLPRMEGHKAGIEAVRRVVSAASELGVHYLTLYAFSIENWKRSRIEVEALFLLMQRFLKAESENIIKNRIRFRTIGRIADLPEKSRKLIRDLEARSKDGDWTLTLALSYGGRTEIVDACESIVREAVEKGRKGKITEEELSSHLYAPDLPDPDLLIRTSGEHRLSNFLLWQIAYTEMVILDTLWPDFTDQHLYEAVLDYQRRERRYGGLPHEGGLGDKGHNGSAR